MGDIDNEWPVRAADLNQQDYFLRTEDEQEEEPYPLHATLKAFIFFDAEKAEGTDDDPHEWMAPKSLTSCTINDLFDVAILEREQEMSGGNPGSEPRYVYKVTIPSPGQDEEILYVSGVPQEAFVFVDDASTGDQFTVEEPFRHYIGIPDELFPQGPWRNVN